MTSPFRLRRSPDRLALLVCLVLGLATAGCGRKIGDACKVSDDCVEDTNDRQCDTSQPGGYCTIVGCDEQGCPEDSACVRFFSPLVDQGRTCDPELEALSSRCRPDELCLRREGSGVCVPRSSERRYCVRTCGKNGDCRDDYLCREAAEPESKSYTGERVKYCAPRPL